VAITTTKSLPANSGDSDGIRETVLAVVNEFSQQGSGYFQVNPILSEIAKRIGARNNSNIEQAILTHWHDLFRMGLIAPGCNLANPNLPFLHLTAIGRKALQQFSRDPSNPDGYLAHLTSQALTDAIALSYVTESLLAYNAVCFKSAAVMLGCATERLVLLVRDDLVSGLGRTKSTISKALSDWRYKTVRDAITKELDSQCSNMTPTRLRDAYSAFWTAQTEQPRLYRNDAGHPQSVDPVTPETVHSNLLIFPELARLVHDLRAWIGRNYV
jgi:hypothetical protein